QLLLAGEVGVEELLTRHSKQAGDPLGDRADRIGGRRRLSVLVQLRAVQRANDAVLVRAEAELQFHLDARPGWRATPPDGLSTPPRGRHAVHGPGDGLEDRRLTGAVGTDDAGQAGAEHELGVLVLAEIGQPNAADLHQPAKPRSTLSTSASPSRTNASRSSSAGRGRRSR